MINFSLIKWLLRARKTLKFSNTLIALKSLNFVTTRASVPPPGGMIAFTWPGCPPPKNSEDAAVVRGH